MTSLDIVVLSSIYALPSVTFKRCVITQHVTGCFVSGRNRRVAARERQRQGRSDDIWDRGSRRDYGERDWSSDRRRDRREREIARDRSPRKDSNGDIQVRCSFLLSLHFFN